MIQNDVYLLHSTKIFEKMLQNVHIFLSNQLNTSRIYSSQSINLQLATISAAFIDCKFLDIEMDPLRVLSKSRLCRSRGDTSDPTCISRSHIPENLEYVLTYE